MSFLLLPDDNDNSQSKIIGSSSRELRMAFDGHHSTFPNSLFPTYQRQVRYHFKPFNYDIYIPDSLATILTTE